MLLDKSGPANPQRAASVRRDLTEKGLELPCLGTVNDFTSPEFWQELDECLELAVNLGISCVSIHTEMDDQDLCEGFLAEILEKIDDLPVTVIVETSGAYSNTEKLRDLLNRFSDDRLAALWNMFTTYAGEGEDPEKSITNLGAYVRHVHIHDFRKENGETVPET